MTPSRSMFHRMQSDLRAVMFQKYKGSRLMTHIFARTNLSRYYLLLYPNQERHVTPSNFSCHLIACTLNKRSEYSWYVGTFYRVRCNLVWLKTFELLILHCFCTISIQTAMILQFKIWYQKKIDPSLSSL